MLVQEQGRPSEPQGLLVRHLHAVQRVWDGGQRGEAERLGQRQLGGRPGLQQQAAHHGVLPQTCAQADHHGREVHAAAEEPGLQGDGAGGEILQGSVLSTLCTSFANLFSIKSHFMKTDW